ncbi:GNAT family N-acetyltransferase [Nitratireductor sp. XY-223]|uniref:GNAT family N-acetyltransferase n=1 Tax=Nitratireductor sp. XY-223 TaxID=2561926 RepID=UPI001981FE92|nr:GNAT family N-acetyltransferase [Nitratireductor sp. XY-223]
MTDKADLEIVPYAAAMKPDILALSMRTWEPVFRKMKPDVQAYVYEAFYPDGWQVRQRADVEAYLDIDDVQTWVAVRAATVLGYVGLRLHPEDRMGEIFILAVDPDHQRQGIGAMLMAFAERQIREAGMGMVMVETGGDTGHQPARAAYEAAGYDRWPVARYFKKL